MFLSFITQLLKRAMYVKNQTWVYDKFLRWTTSHPSWMRENMKFVLGLNIEGLKCGAKAKDCKCNST